MQVTTDDLSGFKEKETNNILYGRYVYPHAKQTNARRGQGVTYIIMAYRYIIMYYIITYYYYYYYYGVAQQTAATEVLGNLYNADK